MQNNIFYYMQLLTLDLEDDYSLIGIHSTEEDYRLAYVINKNLNTHFSRFKHSLDFVNSNAEYPLFEFKDEKTLINYYLINNKFTQLVVSSKNKEDLFGGHFTSTSYLIPEKKNVDFFLKIEGCNNPNFIKKTIEKLNNIHQIIACFSINPNTLKSKDHLIF